MRTVDALALAGLLVVLIAVALQVTGRFSPAVRVTEVPAGVVTVISAPVSDGT